MQLFTHEFAPLFLDERYWGKNWGNSQVMITVVTDGGLVDGVHVSANIFPADVNLEELLISL